MDKNKYTEFLKFIDIISKQNPLQRKRIAALIASQDESYWSFAEDLITILNRSIMNGEQKQIEAAKAYNDLCRSMICEQIKFFKTGKYPSDDAKEVKKTVYDQHDAMYKYIIGLLITQILWPNHYKLFVLFKNVLTESSPDTYLEIGAGHGLYILESLRKFPDLKIDVCDISKASIEVSGKLLTSFGIDIAKINFINDDFFQTSFNGRRFDFINIGEVLEHVNDPVGFLKRAKDFLMPEGIVFLTTCVNCPAIDHVYHFRRVDEIQKILRYAGFEIAKELVIPAEDVPIDQWEQQKITINYGAELKLIK